MSLKSILTVMLALGLLLPSVTGAAESVQRSTDEKGTIHIKTGGEKAKAGEKEGAPSGPGAPGQVSAGEPAAPVAPVTPPQSRRPRGAAAEARQKAFEKAHPDMIKGRPKAQQPQPAAPGAPAAQPEQPPVPESQ